MSKKSLRCLSLLFSLTLALFSGCGPGNGQKITILFTNDLSGHILTDRSGRGGLSRIATEVKKIRAQNSNTVLIDAGDASVGTAFTTETSGEAIFKVMNAAGYQASVYGNHEFDLGEEQAKKYQEITKFPILSCNIQHKDGKPFAAEYAIFEIGGMRLGIIGVSNPKTTNLVDQTKIPGLKFLAPESEIRRVQNELAGKTDMVIILSHQGIGEDISLAYHLNGVPLIIGGHSEVKISGLKKAGRVGIAQAGDNGRYLGRIDFYWDPVEQTAFGFRGRLIAIKKRITEDSVVKTVIDQEAQTLPKDLDQEIGKTWFSVSKPYLGYWMAELLKKDAAADFGIINSGGVRSEVYRGRITKGDIYEVMPFNDRLASFELTGKELMRIKGLGYFYFSRGPKILAGRTYKVASIDFLLRINDFPGARNQKFFDALLRDKMIEQIEQDHGITRFWDK